MTHRLEVLQTHLPLRSWDNTTKGHQGVIISYRVVEPAQGGRGRKPLLVIRGLGMTKDDSVRLAEGLARRGKRRVITLDNRGSGESEKPGFEYKLDDMAYDAVEVMKQELRLIQWNPKQFHLMGVSMGGCIAMKVALQAPQLLASLVLGCTYAESRYNLEVPMSYRELVMKPIPKDAGQRREHMRELFGYSFTAEWIEENSGDFESLLEQYEASEVRRMGTETDPASAKSQEAALLSFLEVGMLHEVASITAPTLVVTGDRDRIIPYSHSLTLRAVIPDAVLSILPRQGHLFWEMDPADTYSTLDTHFALYD